MEFRFFGGNCLTINTKKALISIDDNLDNIGGKSFSGKADIVLFSQEHLQKGFKPAKGQFVVDTPGEYEISEVSVYGIAARAHMDEEKQKNAIIYRVSTKGLMFVSLGHIHPNLSDDEFEQIGMVDILAIPVGGHGYTLDHTAAAKLVKQIEPKIIIPTHYNQDGINYEVPADELEPFVKELGLEPVVEEKLKIGATLPETLQLYKLKS